jgi:hypothetical protein
MAASLTGASVPMKSEPGRHPVVLTRFPAPTADISLENAIFVTKITT